MTYIFPVFLQLYGRNLDTADLQDRMLAQNSVYILSELGLDLGDYGFSFGKNGPISCSLCMDIIESTPPDRKIDFSCDALKAINRLKDVISLAHKLQISPNKWLDLISSAMFVQKYIASSSADREKVISILEEKRPNLDRTYLKSAYEVSKSMIQ